MAKIPIAVKSSGGLPKSWRQIYATNNNTQSPTGSAFLLPSIGIDIDHGTTGGAYSRIVEHDYEFINLYALAARTSYCKVYIDGELIGSAYGFTASGGYIAAGFYGVFEKGTHIEISAGEGIRRVQIKFLDL